MKKKILIIIIVIVALAAVALGLVWYFVWNDSAYIGRDADVDLDYQFIPRPADTEIAPPTPTV